MKKLLYPLIVALLIISCQNNGSGALHAPSNIANVTARPDTGAAVVSWDMPPDSSYLYLEVSYDKYPNNSDTTHIVTQKVSRYTDSVRIKELLHKYHYKFKIQPFNSNPDNKKGGKVTETSPTQPIRRTVKKVFYPDSLTKINVDSSEISASSEGPGNDAIANVLDGDINTAWQTYWPAPHDPPFWVQVDFKEQKTVGAFKYNLRQFGGRGPTQFGLAISENGDKWQQVWESATGLAISPLDKEFSLHLYKNYTSKHFRLLILAKNNPENGFAGLSELSLYKMKSETTDQEKVAEENY